ncbi:hypothetical protein [Leptothermofonsia sp. ETS-13]|uniref:hypothetical protein n=1 Tax=Leptothermofonsia sp. ETS-13 TaxID=3035696 RepID=UPI003BA2058F
MTSQKDQIQALIADIDGVLQKTTPRLPWVMSGEVTQQRQTLERVRNYLVSLQRRMAIQEGYGQPGARQDLLAHDVYPQPGQPPLGTVQGAEPSEISAQQMLQAVVQEMGYLRANLMQPLQTDLENLRQQREMLIQEIQQLEAQRQGYGGLPPQVNQQQIITDFLQALMVRLQETLPQQVAQSLKGINHPSFLPQGASPVFPGSASTVAMGPDSHYSSSEGLQATQAKADQLIINLDSTLKVIFESLERNVRAYQESLSQGLERMHGLGQQGEMMFTALINHLAQQLGREASSYLQSSKQVVELENSPVSDSTAIEAGAGETMSSTGKFTQSGKDTTPSTPKDPSLHDTLANLTLPYPGAELPPAVGEAAVPADLSVEPPLVETSVDAAIDAWLKSASATTGVSLENPDLSNLNLPGLNLGELDLNQIDTQEIDAILETETGSDADYLAEEAATLADSDLPFAGAAPAGEEDTEDIDAALKLLEQLSAELKDEPVITSLEDAEAEIDRMLNISESSVDTPAAFESISESISEDAQNELDEFYESLFGAGAEDTSSEESATSQPPLEEAPVELVADPTLGWELPAPEQVSEPEGPESLSSEELSSLPEEPEFETSLETSPPDQGPAGLEEPLIATLSNLPGGDKAVTATTDESESLSLFAESIEEPLTAGENEITTLTDLFEDVVPPGGVRPQEPRVAAGTEAIAAIPEDLTPAIDALQATSKPAPGQNARPEGAEDWYAPASPEEDLLPVEETPTEPTPSLWVDDLTLSSLSEDLSSLEGGPGQTSQVPESELMTLQEEEPVLTDWSTEPSPGVGDEPVSQDFAIARTGNIPDLSSIDKEVLLPSEPATNTFTLEGMDDLFGDVPTTPSVSPTSPPAVPADQTPFTLEGMSDLFADMPPAPTVSPASPPSSVASTDSPIIADFSESLGLPPPDLPPLAESSAQMPVAAPTEPLPFTLEGMDDLFEDVPPVEPPLASVEPALTSSSSVSSSVAFTLEGMGDLFTDAPPLGGSPPAESVELADQPVAPLAEQPTPSDELSPFTLEQVGDILMEVPAGAMIEPPAMDVEAKQPEAFTLEQMGDVFMEVPLGGTSSPAGPMIPASPPAVEQSEAFTLEQIGDLFVEVPSVAESSEDSSSVEPPAPEPEAAVEQPITFSLEQIGDLFMEVPTDTSSPAETSPSSSEPSGFASEALEKKKTN